MPVPMSMPSSDRRFLIAVLVSVSLHLAVLVGSRYFQPLWRTLPSAEAAAPRATLDARLLPAIQEALPPPEDPLLKNTLAEATPETVEPAPAPAPRPPAEPEPQDASLLPPKPVREAPKVVREAQLKLAAHMFYPPEAIARGLEGEVRVLLNLAPDGSILEVSLAAGSGHELLDQAALSAALAMRRVPVTGAEELILPVVFKLQ